MATFNKLDDWQEYIHLREEILNDKIGYRDLETIPKNLKKLFERENILTPADISHDLLREMFVLSAKKQTADFAIDSNNEKVINTLIRYLRRDETFLKEDSSFSFQKGLLIRGSVGTGKTVLFKALAHLKSQLRFFCIKDGIRFFPKPETFACITANKIVHNFNIEGFLIFEPGNSEQRKTQYCDLVTQPLFIDDLGSEPEAVHYGAKAVILSELLIMRYAGKSITHATSNLDIDSLKSIYGLRVYDRMCSMFNDITLTGGSRRK